MAEQMNVGLEKLSEAQESVDELRLELAEKEKDIKVATEKAEVVSAWHSQKYISVIDNEILHPYIAVWRDRKSSVTSIQLSESILLKHLTKSFSST